MKWLYKYPQRGVPVRRPREDEPGPRSRKEPEYELVDTGVFDDGRYWDVFVEYAKADPRTSSCRMTVANRGPDEATLHVLPHLWFRNTWSWTRTAREPALLAAPDRAPGTVASPRRTPTLGRRSSRPRRTAGAPLHRERVEPERLAGLPERGRRT